MNGSASELFQCLCHPLFDHSNIATTGSFLVVS
jgi:hypothetical protein